MDWVILAGVAVAVLAVLGKPVRGVYLILAASVVFLQPNIGSGNSTLRAVASVVFAGVLLLSCVGRVRDIRPRSLLWLPVMFAATAGIVAMHGGSALAALFDVLVVACAVAAVRCRFGRDLLVKSFVGLCVLVGASYAVTVAGWLMAGFDALQVGAVAGAYGYDVPVHFPFTVTISSVNVFDVPVPRLTGFAREPGWMAMYATVAFVLYPHAGFKRKWPRLLLPLAVVGALSTAGFGVFLVTFAAGVLVAYRRRGWRLFTQRVFGLGLLSVGSWMALMAPVLGVMAKGNVISAAERGAATGAGLDSLQSFDLGGGASDSAIANVNLIASVGGLGLLFAVCAALGVLLPFTGRAFWKARRWSVAPAFAAIFATFLFAQPANSSAFAFACVAIVAAAGANARPPQVLHRRDNLAVADAPSEQEHIAGVGVGRVLPVPAHPHA